MKAEAIREVAKLTDAAQRPNVLTVPGDSKTRYWLWNPAKNEYEEKDRHADRDRRFLSLPTLADFASSVTDSPISFWFSRSGVILDMDAEDYATLPLTLSAPLRQLAEWEKSHRPLKQIDAVLILRTIFPGMAVPGDLVSIVSNVQWKIDEMGKGVTGQGTRSVGRAIEARLENRDKIPDTVVFNVPIWENGGALVSSIQAGVVCALDADPTNQTFLFVPQAGAVEAAIAGGEIDLERILRTQLGRVYGKNAGPPVYHGTPTK